MNHPELLVVPILMLADYALTILGAKRSAVVYRNHFTTPSYELNPLWRKDVNQLRWFNPRHISLVVIVTALLVVVDRAVRPYELFELALGMLFGAFGAVCGRHLANLMLFHYLNRHPTEISGQVQLSMKLMLKLSEFNFIGLIPVFTIVAVLVPNRYTIGVLLGLLALVFAHFVWAARTKPAENKHEQAIHAELVDTEAQP
jgi:lysylphosphatidylglycerol synthetase-like protein (DUF2156 family)